MVSLDYAIVNTGRSLTTEDGKNAALQRIGSSYGFGNKGPLDVMFLYNDLIKDTPAENDDSQDNLVRKALSLEIVPVNDVGIVSGNDPINRNIYEGAGLGIGSASVDPNPPELTGGYELTDDFKRIFEHYTLSENGLTVLGFSNRNGLDLSEYGVDPPAMALEAEQIFDIAVDSLGLQSSLIYSDF